MTGCSAISCSNRTEQGYCLKVFPKDPKRRALWTAKVKRLNWVPTDRSFLCEVHFDADQWEINRSDGKRKLKCDAVPTIFHHIPKHCKRKPPIELSILENKRLKLTDEFANKENETIEQFDTDVTKLKQELMNAHETITRLKKENAILKSKLRLKAVQVSKYKKSRVKQYANIFNEDQLEAIQRQNMAFRNWSPRTVETALGLKFSCGIRGYENLLHLQLPYPSNRTLQRRLENLKFQGGILHEVLQFLKIKVECFPKKQQKYCALLLDEMSITEGIDYDLSTNSYFGEATFPGQKGKANHALVFMLGGLSTRWKQVIAYYFTNGQSDGPALKNIIVEIIKETEKIGLHIVSVTSDMGSCNQAMWKSFGITASRLNKTNCSITHPCDSSRTINFIADIPHLLKNIRTALLKNKHFIIPKVIQKRYSLQTSIVNPQHLEDLAKYQENMELKLAPKLTIDKLNDKHFDKMKVSRATSVVSHDVSVALKFLAEEQDDKSLLTTSWFLKTIDKWFNLMTSRHPVTALSKLNVDRYLESLTFLEEVIDLFENLKVINVADKAVWKPIQTGVIISTQAILNLQNDLLGENKFHFLETSRFSQDALENLFSLVRSKQVIPTALQFKNNLKLISVAQYLKTCTGSYDDDEGNFLSVILRSHKINPSTETSKIILPKHWDRFPLSLTSVEENCLYNISGYLMSSIYKKNSTCPTCFDFVATKEKNNAACAKLVSLRQFKDGCLFFVKEDLFYSLFYKLELIFRSLEPFIININNCSAFIKEKINVNTEICAVIIPDCHAIKQKIQNRFITFRLKIFALKRNRELGKLTKAKLKPDLGSKSCAMRTLAKKI